MTDTILHSLFGPYLRLNIELTHGRLGVLLVKKFKINTEVSDMLIVKVMRSTFIGCCIGARVLHVWMLSVLAMQ